MIYDSLRVCFIDEQRWQAGAFLSTQKKFYFK